MGRGRRSAGHPAGEAQLGAAADAYARCSRVERLLWRRLAVFAASDDGFDRPSVREVCGSGALPAAEVLAVFDRLAPQLLVGAADGHRYRMPPAQQALGARELGLNGERWIAVLHHRRWALGVARQACEWWGAGRQDEARALALRELPDLRAAMDPATGPLSPHAEAGTSLEIVVALWFLWTACGRAAEGRGLLRHALALHRDPRRPARCGSPRGWSSTSARPRPPTRCSARRGRRRCGPATTTASASSRTCGVAGAAAGAHGRGGRRVPRRARTDR
ncbi:hypothetical protein V2W30_20665 [Streptomyces sp. Q6]|uniref:Uncharacterized protein n=1 Tax=Streptomyces citrinus TaxID=3118173 RepID=A0ACD5AF36_9ACTN